MQLLELKNLLKTHPRKAFRLSLPNGVSIPGSFHITEVGHIQKTFLDCGGKLHESATCQLQVWIGEDEDHTIETGKMAGILEKANTFLGDDTVPLEIEYEDEVISQYVVDRHVVTDGSVILYLANKHTACLALELCGQPGETSEAAAGEECCANSGCC